jgi:hypothetical protein
VTISPRVNRSGGGIAFSRLRRRCRLIGRNRETEATMKGIILVALLTGFGLSSATAQSCDSRAFAADGKPLHGAAKTSFLKKCKQDACEGKAFSADGKPLHGAAKNSFMAKCKKDA